MSATATDPQVPAVDRPEGAAGDVTQVGRVTQWRVIRSEWTKLRSVRSTGYSMLVAVILTLGFGVIASIAGLSHHTDANSFDPLARSLAGVSLGGLTFGVLGILAAAGEYSTGMIRSSMMAVPKRLPVLWGKALTFGALVLVISVPLVLATFFLSQAILSGKGLSIAFSTAGVPRAVFGAALYMTLSAVFALGFGAILRNTAAGITSYVALMFVVPQLLTLLPASIANTIIPYMPSNAGQAVMNLTRQAHTLAPWTGLIVCALWAIVSLAVAAILMVRRDV